MPEVPATFAEVMTDPEAWKAIRADIALIRQLRNLKITTPSGVITLQQSPGAENAALDLRDIVPSTQSVASAGASDYTRMLRLASAQSIPNATQTDVILDTVPTNGNNFGLWVPGEPTRLTIRRSGLYFFDSEIQWASNSTGARYTILSVSSVVDVMPSDIRPAASGIQTHAGRQTVQPMVAGNYVTLKGYQDTGGNLNIVAASLSAVRLGDLPF